MTTLLRSGRAILALALVLLSPGLEPYAAAAGNMAAGARVAPAAIMAPAPGMGAINVPAATFNLPSSIPTVGVNAGVLKDSPSLRSGVAIPSVIQTALPAAAGAVESAKAAAPNAAHPSAAPAATVLKDAPSLRSGVPAQGQLTTGAKAIVSAAAPTGSANEGRATLDNVFSGSAKLPSAADSVVAGAQPASLGAYLGRSSAAGGSRQEQAPPPSGPRQSLSRSARVGLVAALVPMAITFATMAVASAVGYHFHAGYQNPFPQHMTAVTAIVSLIGAAFMAPVSEEMIFRGGIMGWFQSKVPARFGQTMAFVIPAVLSSLIFVAMHELSDPVLFATRFVHSLILSYAFQKEGYTGSMFAHGFFNGLLILPAVAAVLIPGVGGTLAAALIAPAALYFGWRALKKIMAERAEKKSGALVAYQLSARQGVMLGLALIAGFLFLMPNIIWIIGALGWLGYAYKRRAR